MAHYLASSGSDVIVPMPLHWRKRLERGFNQSELLAKFVSKRTGIPLAPGLKRRKRTDPQAGLTRAQRRTNGPARLR